MKKRNFGPIASYLAIFVIIVLAFSFFGGQSKKKETMTFSQMVAAFESESVKSFTLEGSTVTCKMQDGTEKKHTLLSLGLFDEHIMPMVVEQAEKGVITEYDFKEGFVLPWWVSFIPYILLLVGMVAVFVIMNRQMNGGGSKGPAFARARFKMGNTDKNKKTFADVAGADEEKEELKEMVDFLKEPRKFLDLGARIPKGVLLIGPPGTGKTLLAKAVAGEAGVPFFTMSGSDFVELYVGVGASRVRDLFEEAKKDSPCIIFIDEIDAVGRQRGTGLGGGHDEREQTLNQLLVEMDGFGVNSGIIVMAATNRADVLDPALLRPGRFDRQVYVGTPDAKGREEILKVHAKGKTFDSDVSLADIAKETIGFTGADLENLLNEAALLAARQNRTSISRQNVQDAVMKVVAGPEKRSRKIVEKERKLTAYHEAGHAVVAKFLPTADPVHEISIIPRGRAGGYTMYLPKEDLSYHTRNEMLEDIVSLLGGRASEELTLDDISTGASNDIERATAIARQMVTRYGMSEAVGPILYGSDPREVFLGRDLATHKDYSEKVAAQIDDEVRRIIDEAYSRAKTILTENMETVKAVAEKLLQQEKMTGEEFAAFFEPPVAEETAPAEQVQSDTTAEEVTSEEE